MDAEKGDDQSSKVSGCEPILNVIDAEKGDDQNSNEAGSELTPSSMEAKEGDEQSSNEAVSGPIPNTKEAEKGEVAKGEDGNLKEEGSETDIDSNTTSTDGSREAEASQRGEGGSPGKAGSDVGEYSNSPSIPDRITIPSDGYILDSQSERTPTANGKDGRGRVRIKHQDRLGRRRNAFESRGGPSNSYGGQTAIPEVINLGEDSGSETEATGRYIRKYKRDLAEMEKRIENQEILLYESYSVKDQLANENKEMHEKMKILKMSKEEAEREKQEQLKTIEELLAKQTEADSVRKRKYSHASDNTRDEGESENTPEDWNEGEPAMKSELLDNKNCEIVQLGSSTPPITSRGEIEALIVGRVAGRPARAPFWKRLFRLGDDPQILGGLEDISTDEEKRDFVEKYIEKFPTSILKGQEVPEKVKLFEALSDNITREQRSEIETFLEDQSSLVKTIYRLGRLAGQRIPFLFFQQLIFEYNIITWLVRPYLILFRTPEVQRVFEPVYKQLNLSIVQSAAQKFYDRWLKTVYEKYIESDQVSVPLAMLHEIPTQEELARVTKAEPGEIIPRAIMAPPPSNVENWQAAQIVVMHLTWILIFTGWYEDWSSMRHLIKIWCAANRETLDLMYGVEANNGFSPTEGYMRPYFRYFIILRLGADLSYPG
ncbi:MAG: hypothetical protein M1829_004329 [Trizodia sp. TS-e1964]|nr:MAG: hypothetical protein M1829_004329 [Trizodia sp. TS-e1964]